MSVSRLWEKRIRCLTESRSAQSQRIRRGFLLIYLWFSWSPLHGAVFPRKAPTKGILKAVVWALCLCALSVAGVRLRRCNGPKPVPGSATLGVGAGVLCCGLKTRATALVLWLGAGVLCCGLKTRATALVLGAVVETSSWLRYTLARCLGSVLRSKDSRYGWGSVT
ncbi:Unannotated [Lentimonas sp. CC4]|nr:Unannotated [Lentimonas sp. CC4]